MREMQKKRKVQALLYSKTSLFILLIIILLLCRATWGVYKKYTDSAKAMATAQEEAAALEARQKTIESENKKLITKEGVDGEIRKRFPVSKNNEEVFIITGDAGNTGQGKDTSDSWWSRVQAFFGKKSQ